MIQFIKDKIALVKHSCQTTWILFSMASFSITVISNLRVQFPNAFQILSYSNRNGNITAIVILQVTFTRLVPCDGLQWKRL